MGEEMMLSGGGQSGGNEMFGQMLGHGMNFLGSWLDRNHAKKMAARQHERQLELMGVQFRNQMGLNDQASKLAFDMWNKTNYGAQMEHLKKAGLNPALLYKQSGSGGTTNAGSGGSASGGQAPMENFIGIKEKMAELALITAQAENIKADTDLKKEKATTEDELRWFNKTLLIENANLSMAQKEQAIANSSKLNEEAINLNYKNNAIANNKDLYFESQWAEMNRQIFEKNLAESKVKLSDEQKRQIEHKIWQDWVNAGSGLLASSSFVMKAIKELANK